jgi:putative membrane protein
MGTTAQGCLGRRKWIALSLLLLFALLTNLAPLHPRDQVLQQGPAAALLACLVLVARRHPISDGAFFLALVFLGLHEFAARWIYSNVPYDEWTQSLFGLRLSQHFGWRRNHFDRLVHAASGVCLLPGLEQAIGSMSAARPGWARAGAWFALLALGALYEIGEWLVALAFAPGRAEDYIGQQGDVWDAQKDMACALLGASACALWRTLAGRRGRTAA